ncbi:MAG: hypothetical protein QXY70_03730, partial [Nanopusillaceae archaeon]
MIKTKGISPLIGFVMVLGISIFLVTLSLTVIKPTLERNRAINVINEASTNLELMSSIIKDVASEAPGSKRTISLTISDGVYYFDKEKNSLVFYYNSLQKVDLLGKIGDKFLSIGTIFYDFFANNNLDKYRIISGNWNIKNRLEGINGTIYIPINGSYNSIFVSSRFSSENNLGQLFLDPAPENLVLYLPFDEGSGNIVYDYSGNNNHGVLYNNLVWTDGMFGRALSFDGIDDYVDCGNIPSLTLTGPFSLSAWIKPMEGTQKTIIAKGNSTD